MKEGYKKKLSNKKIHFLVITGDLHQYNKKYDETIKFLDELAIALNIEKENVFVVPGNHDASDDYEDKSLHIKDILENINRDPDYYSAHFIAGKLKKSFSSYKKQFIANFYKEKANERYPSPEDVSVWTYDDKINIIHLNTAIISDGRDHAQIIDINRFARVAQDPRYKKNLPTIVIGHHHYSDLCPEHQKVIKRVFSDLKVSCYLCGDRHTQSSTPIDTFINTTIPCFDCGKSVVTTFDDHSHFGFNLFELNCESRDNNVSVQPYLWIPDRKRFEISPAFEDDDGNKKKFTLKTVERGGGLPQSFRPKAARTGSGSIAENDSVWLVDAETAKGKQIRYDNYTSTNRVELCLSDDIWGISSVKGIGKTFVLQVKRIKMAEKDYFLLPDVDKLTSGNNWGTSTIILKEVNLKTLKDFNNLESLWKYSLICYVICSIINSGKKEYEKNKGRLELCKAIRDYYEDGKISSDTHGYCTKSEYMDFNALFVNIIKQSNWMQNITDDSAALLLPKNKLRRFIEEGGKECIGVFIDKIDQSTGGINESEELWQHLQLSLVSAVYRIKHEYSDLIKVFYTIRPEAYFGAGDIFKDTLGKINMLTKRLYYTMEDQEKIFRDCIRIEEGSFLFDERLKMKPGREEEAFLGIKELCHPYVEGATESVFECVYRHSFDRNRDIQLHGEKLAAKLNEITQAATTDERMQIVLETIEKAAATLAYVRAEYRKENDSYYHDKSTFIPAYWRETKNFEKLLRMIKKNVLFTDDATEICSDFNDKKDCGEKHCSDSECKRHPITVLYKLGLLGTISINKGRSNHEEQVFLNASDVTYILEDKENCICGDENLVYLVHPALTKSIERTIKNGTKIKHFKGFIIGKNRRVSKEKLKELAEDKKTMPTDDFDRKYFQ